MITKQRLRVGITIHSDVYAAFKRDDNVDIARFKDHAISKLSLNGSGIFLRWGNTILRQHYGVCEVATFESEDLANDVMNYVNMTGF